VYRLLDWDRLAESERVKGPVIVPISEVITDPAQIDERTVKHYVATDTQRWYFEPITCVQRYLDKGYEANGVHAHSQVEACRRLGYRDLQICYVNTP
jgi:hypothetical protein